MLFYLFAVEPSPLSRKVVVSIEYLVCVLSAEDSNSCLLAASSFFCQKDKPDAPFFCTKSSPA